MRCEPLKLKAELSWAQEARDLLKKPPHTLSSTRGRYAFIWSHQGRYVVQLTSRVSGVWHLGYYAWERSSLPAVPDDDLLPGLICESYESNSRTNGASRVLCDLREGKEHVCKTSIATLMKWHTIRVERGYSRPVFAMPNRPWEPPIAWSNRF